MGPANQTPEFLNDMKGPLRLSWPSRPSLPRPCLGPSLPRTSWPSPGPSTVLAERPFVQALGTSTEGIPVKEENKSLSTSLTRQQQTGAETAQTTGLPVAIFGPSTPLGHEGVTVRPVVLVGRAVCSLTHPNLQRAFPEDLPVPLCLAVDVLREYLRRATWDSGLRWTHKKNLPGEIGARCGANR